MREKVSFSLSSKPQSTSLRQPSALADDRQRASKTYVTEFGSAEAPPQSESERKSIPAIPNTWPPDIKWKNVPNMLDGLSDGADSVLQFEIDRGSNFPYENSSLSYGLNLRKQPGGEAENNAEFCSNDNGISDLQLRKLREDLRKLSDHKGIDEYNDMPVEGFGVALLSGYGWKEGRGIGRRNVKEDIKVKEIKKWVGRGGLGYKGDLPGNQL